MTYRVILDRSFVNSHVVTRDYGTEQLHLIETTGAFTREQRAPVFQEALKSNSSGNLYYILDNRAGHEIQLSPEDMSFMNNMLFDSGIRYVRGAVVTNDEGYGALIALAQAKAITTSFDVELTSTTDYAEAEEFVLSRLREKLKS